VLHVPFQGYAPAVTSTIAGQTDIVGAPIPLVAAYIKDGTLRALAIEADKRSPMLPDVPTLTEAGVPGHEGGFAGGILVPAGTPKEIVNLLHSEIARIVFTPDVKDRLAALGFDPVANTPEEFAAWIKAETAKWGKVVRATNMKID
jgi:tripartite-type tricarboxylate transporter receptor subunit TctC